jgi:hypothetical protein
MMPAMWKIATIFGAVGVALCLSVGAGGAQTPEDHKHSQSNRPVRWSTHFEVSRARITHGETRRVEGSRREHHTVNPFAERHHGKQSHRISHVAGSHRADWRLREQFRLHGHGPHHFGKTSQHSLYQHGSPRHRHGSPTQGHPRVDKTHRHHVRH